MAEHRTTPDPNQTGMPSGIPYIVGNEAAERFSFYGMKAILTVFLTEHLVNSANQPATLNDEQARAAVAGFTSLAYATPFLGALLSDWVWGKYSTILRLSMVYCLGHAILAMVDLPLGVEPYTVFMTGLVVIALGSGGIKPCVTAHVGDQFGPANARLLPRVFAWFYFSINAGAVVAQFLTPILLEKLGPAWAFGIPGLLMVVATITFWLGRNTFVHIPPGGDRFVTEALTLDSFRTLLRISPLLVFVAVFWSLFDQTASEWVLQAKALDRTLFDAFGLTLELSPSQLQAINPLLVLLLIPVMNFVVYPAAGRVVSVTPLRKIGAGFLLTAASFALGAIVESWVQTGATPSIWWQVLMYLLLTSGEVMLSITAYEFYYTQAPRQMKSLVMACYMLSISAGNLLTLVVNTVIQTPDGGSRLPGASYYWFFTGLMVATLIGYCFWAPTYRGQTYLQGDDTPDDTPDTDPRDA